MNLTKKICNENVFTGIASAIVGRASSVGRPASVGRPSVDLHHQQLYFKPEKNVRRANSFHDMEGSYSEFILEVKI